MDPLRNIDIRSISDVSQDTAESTPTTEQPSASGISNLPDVLESGAAGSPFEQELMSKSGRLELDQNSIDQAIKQADEKFQNSMDSANISLWTGIIQGVSSLLGANSPEVTALQAHIDASASNGLQSRANATDIYAKQLEQQAALADDLQKQIDSDASNKVDRIKAFILDFLEKMKELNPDLLK